MSLVRIWSFTFFAVGAFAANSVICRLALGQKAIDAGSFTAIRLISGALTLILITSLRAKPYAALKHGRLVSAIALFVYAIAFSFAYLTLDTGTGAVILFGCVQITMIFYSLFKGNRLTILEWLGLCTALAGFIYLVSPRISTPAAFGFMLMALAGLAWAVYTLRGKTAQNPLLSTTGNFVLTVPLAMVLFFLVRDNLQFSQAGILLAILSGCVASGLGYTIWYHVLPHLSVTEAAVVQLAAPALAALGGIVFMSEVATLRLGISSLAILGGIFAVILGRRSTNRKA